MSYNYVESPSIFTYLKEIYCKDLETNKKVYDLLVEKLQTFGSCTEYTIIKKNKSTTFSVSFCGTEIKIINSYRFREHSSNLWCEIEIPITSKLSGISGYSNKIFISDAIIDEITRLKKLLD
jgi:hypothetical protein